MLSTSAFSCLQGNEFVVETCTGLKPAVCSCGVDAWIEYANNPELKDVSPGQLCNKRLCEDHFAPEMFLQPGPRSLRIRKRLKTTAVPTVPVCDPELRHFVLAKFYQGPQPSQAESPDIPPQQLTPAAPVIQDKGEPTMQTSTHYGYGSAAAQQPHATHSDHIYCKLSSPSAHPELRECQSDPSASRTSRDVLPELPSEPLASTVPMDVHPELPDYLNEPSTSTSMDTHQDFPEYSPQLFPPRTSMDILPELPDYPFEQTTSTPSEVHLEQPVCPPKLSTSRTSTELHSKVPRYSPKPPISRISTDVHSKVPHYTTKPSTSRTSIDVHLELPDSYELSTPRTSIDMPSELPDYRSEPSTSRTATDIRSELPDYPCEPSTSRTSMDVLPELLDSSFKSSVSSMEAAAPIDDHPAYPSEPCASFETASSPPLSTIPTHSTPRKVRRRIRKVLTPHSQKRLQHFKNENLRLRQIIARMKKPVKRTL